MEAIKVIKVGDEEFTLELDRKSIMRAEEVYGVSISKVEDQFVSQSYKLFRAALHKNHSNISIDARDDLFDKFVEEGGDRQEVVNFLLEQFGNFFKPTTKTKK